MPFEESVVRPTTGWKKLTLETGQCPENIIATPTNADPCVYKIEKTGNVIFVIVYVNDILIFSRYDVKIKSLGNELSREFNMKD